MLKQEQRNVVLVEGWEAEAAFPRGVRGLQHGPLPQRYFSMKCEKYPHGVAGTVLGSARGGAGWRGEALGQPHSRAASLLGCVGAHGSLRGKRAHVWLE